MSAGWRRLVLFVALWGAWKDAVSVVAWGLALPASGLVPALLAVRAVAWLWVARGLARGTAGGARGYLALWAITSVGMTAWWVLTDPISAGLLFAAVSTVGAWGVWRGRYGSSSAHSP